MSTMSIVIPCKDDVAIRNCLASIDEDVEVVVVFNGGTYEVEGIVNDFAVKHGRTVIVQAGPPNLAGALQRGSLAASGDILLYMDTDCTFVPGVIRRFKLAAETHEVVKGVQAFDRGSWTSTVVANSRDHITSAVVTAFKPPLAIRANIKERIGGHYFDERLRWREDGDLDYRIRKAGIPIHFEPNAIVRHAALTMRQDLRSAYRWGTGEGRAHWYGVPLTSTPSSMLSTFRSKGVFPALYMGIRTGVFNFGMYMEYIRLKKRLTS